jgi:Fe-S cluster assembly ATPase SufC
MPDLANPNNVRDLNKALKNMMEILALDEDKFNRYINIHDSENKENNNELIILEALSNHERNALDTLQFAVKWNQVEKAKEILQRTKVSIGN